MPCGWLPVGQRASTLATLLISDLLSKTSIAHYPNVYCCAIIIICNGDWPSGKATGSGPVIGVRSASGTSQENLPVQLHC